MQFSNFDIGFANSAYLAGAVLGALGFGWLTDRIGRKKLFFITLALYLAATAATALSWRCRAAIALFRFLTGAGIGGEYTAINSTIQELVPARYRGWTDLVINGSFWIGAAIGAVRRDRAARSASDRSRSRLAAGVSHRRLSRPRGVRDAAVDSGKPALADDPRPAGSGARIVADIERSRDRAHSEHAQTGLAENQDSKMRRPHAACARWRKRCSHAYRQRSLVGLALMIAQAFFYNAIFFTYALVLTDFFGIPANQVGWYLLPFAAGNFLGPLLLGRLFDTLGRRDDDRVHLWRFRRSAGRCRAICSRSACLSAQTQTIAWMVIFFFASPAASAAYLTVSETFPLEVRALAIALFYADRHRDRRRRRSGAVRRADRYRLA